MRDALIGAIVTLTVLFLSAVAFAPLTPDLAILGPLARMLEGMIIHLWLLCLILAIALLALDAERMGIAVLVILVTFAGVYGWRHINQTERVTDAAGPRLRVVWFNMFVNNQTPPDQLVAALNDSGADLILLTETNTIQDRFDDLDSTYPHQYFCGGTCGLVALSKLPFAQAEGRGRPSHFPHQRMRIDVVPEGSVPVSIAVAHFFKPWVSGAAAAERRRLIKLINGAGDNVLVVGDFNAAPWSLPVQQILERADLTGPFRPRTSWPVPLTWAGVPIDHIYWRGGVKVARLAPFGADLGSNHRGFVADIVLPTPPKGQ